SRHSFRVYRGLVPISPNTTPSAPRERAARLARWPSWALPAALGGGKLLVPTSIGSEVISSPSGSRDVLVLWTITSQEMGTELAPAQSHPTSPLRYQLRRFGYWAGSVVLLGISC